MVTAVAFVVVLSVMITHHIGGIGQGPGGQSLRRLIRTAGHAAVQPDAGRRPRRQRAAAAAAARQAALPYSACVLRDRNPCTVSADAVREGDIVLLRPGDVLPADGVVLEGQSSVEESLLTGDPTPVDKHKGCTVFAGTRNGDSALICRATHTGSDTALAHICAAARGTAGPPGPLARPGLPRGWPAAWRG